MAWGGAVKAWDYVADDSGENTILDEDEVVLLSRSKDEGKLDDEEKAREEQGLDNPQEFEAGFNDGEGTSAVVFADPFPARVRAFRDQVEIKEEEPQEESATPRQRGGDGKFTTSHKKLRQH